MYYIDILNAKREALTVARNNCKAALDVCKDQEAAFDKSFAYSVFLQNGESASFWHMLEILKERTFVVKKQLSYIDKMIADCEHELTLLDWCRV